MEMSDQHHVPAVLRPRKKPQHQRNRRLDESHSWFRLLEKKKKYLAPAGIRELPDSNIDWFISHPSSFINYCLFRRVFVQDRDRWLVLVNAVMNLQVP
jgi:hypothetical protein